MLIVYHENNEVSSVYDLDNESNIVIQSKKLVKCLKELSSVSDDKLIIWCHVSQKDNLALDLFSEIFHHQKIMASFNGGLNYLPESIGYVEDSVFVNVNKEVMFPTWQMSSFVGGMYATVLNEVSTQISCDVDFDYFLVSLAKTLMPLGLICYSEPLLLKDSRNINDNNTKCNSFQLFRFVKQHYKSRWVFLLFLDYILYERKFKFLPLLNSFFYKQLKLSDSILDAIIINSTKKLIGDKTVDVIIPTIGRKKYLYDVLCDFRQQTHLPIKIIIVEQNPLTGSKSELDYLHNEVWPFDIQHTFTHQAGACNARNIALSKTDSKWIFLADDDNRFTSSLIEDILEKISLTGNEVVSTNYMQHHEKLFYNKIIQWPTFGAGNSFVSRDAIEGIKFSMALEFGYGEDADFGMQLRQNGFDILYLPQPEILHLKAPIGGFRTKPTLQWQNDSIQPKPSPTVMLFKIMYNTPQQLMGYKTVLFFKFYKKQTIQNPFRYYQNFQKQWERSIYWANQLKIQN